MSVCIFFYLWSLVAFRDRKCLVLAFWRARELTKRQIIWGISLFLFTSLSQLIAALTSCFSSKRELCLTERDAEAQSPQSCRSDRWLAFSLPHRKHQPYRSAVCKRFRREQPSQEWEVPRDGNKCIWRLAIIRCHTVSEWWAPSALTWSVSNYISAGFSIASQPEVRVPRLSGLFVIVFCCCFWEWLIYTRWKFSSNRFFGRP